MRRPSLHRLCTCTLAGARVEMVPRGDGSYRCLGCGASETGIRLARARVQADWTGGGPGFRPAPRTFLGVLWSAPSRYRLVWAS